MTAYVNPNFAIMGRSSLSCTLDCKHDINA